MEEFLTAYGKRKKTETPTGEKYEQIYEYQEDKKGNKKLVITGETNIYERIQEQLEETKIENILRRAAVGDNSVFRPDGIYEDTTIFPKTIHEQTELARSIPELERKLQEETTIIPEKGVENNEQEHGTTLQEHTTDINEKKQI